MIEILENRLDVETGWRVARVLSDGALSAEMFEGWMAPEARGLARMEAELEPNLGLYTLSLRWPARDALDFCTWPKPRRLVVWTVTEGERGRECIRLAAGLYERIFGGRPGYAFLGSWPKDLAWDAEESGCAIVQAEWMPRRCVGVGGLGL
jgi:hypothetical protein